MTESWHAAFLSYASEDAAAAQRISDALRAAGVEVWFDKSELRGGDAWDESIRNQIKACGLFIPVISSNARARLEGYFRLEWKLAIDRSHRIASKHPFLLPVVIDDTRQADDAIPERFRDLQWTRLPNGETPPAFVDRVRRLLTPEAAAGRLGPAQQRPGSAMEPTLSRSAPPPWAWKPALWAIGALLAVALAYFVAEKFWISKRTTTAATSAAARSNTAREKSIAVLPFVDMTEKKDQEYFGDGMAEEIIDLLAKMPGLTVIGRTSSFQFKGKNTDLRAIGTQLNAAYVLEGSVRKSGDQVRITAQLINTRTGTHEWSDTYDRHIDDVLKLQDAIAVGVARELQITVADKSLVSRSTVNNGDVYDLVLRGRSALDRVDKEGIDEAVILFQQAHALDPTSADAAAELAISYGAQVLVGSVRPVAGFEQARRAAKTALELDPKNVLAHAAMAQIHIVYDWDWRGAEHELKSAAALAPGDVSVLESQATLSWALGRWDDGVSQIKAALAQDPLNPEVLQLLSSIQEFRGHLPEAEVAMRRALEIRPTYGYGHYNIGLILLERRDPDAAFREMEQEAIDDGRQQGLALVFHALGRHGDSDAALANLLKEPDENALDIAEVYAFRDQSDEAMQWLDRAYAQKAPYLYYVKGDPLLKNLHPDPRYKAFLRKMNLPE